MKHARIPRHLWSLGLAGALALGLALGPESGSRAGAQPAPPPPPLPNASLTPIPTDSPTPLPSGVPVPTAEPSAGPPTAAPTVTPAPRRRRGRRGASEASAAPAGPVTPSPEPTATPTSPAFATLDGTWELQLQYIDRTEYSYLTLAQTTGGALSGTWHLNGKNAPSYPVTGTYDGRLIRFSAAEPSGPVAFDGYVEGASDMIGLAKFGATAASAPATPSPTAPIAPLTANDGVAFTAEHRGAVNHRAVKR